VNYAGRGAHSTGGSLGASFYRFLQSRPPPESLDVAIRVRLSGARYRTNIVTAIWGFSLSSTVEMRKVNWLRHRERKKFRDSMELKLSDD
jgi:hypothetical protein